MQSSSIKGHYKIGILLLTLTTAGVSFVGIASAGFGTPKVLGNTPSRGIRDIVFMNEYAICRSRLGIALYRMHAGDSAEFITDFPLGSPLEFVPSGHFRPKIAGNLVYVPGWLDGLWIVDLANPESPVILNGSAVPIPQACRELVVKGDYAYVGTSGLERIGLLTVDISDPMNAHVTDTHATAMSVLDMTLYHEQVYAAAYHTYTYSVAQPDAVELLDENGSTGRAYGIRATENHLLVADLYTPSASDGALAVFSRSDSAAPVFLGREEVTDGHHDADVIPFGSRAIVLSLEGFLHVVDISDPTNPQRLSAFDTNTPCVEGMTLKGDYLYLTDQFAGVLVYKLANRGDCDDDGLRNSVDVIWLVNHVFRSGPPPVIAGQGDCNCDGALSSADIIYLVNYIFKGGPPPFC